MSWIIWTILGIIAAFIMLLVWSVCKSAKEADEIWLRAVEQAKKDYDQTNHAA